MDTQPSSSPLWRGAALEQGKRRAVFGSGAPRPEFVPGCSRIVHDGFISQGYNGLNG